MSEIMVVDFMGAAICGQDVNMRAAVIAALTNAAANSLLAKDESHSASMMPAEKKEKLKGAKNLPPNSKKSSQKTHSSQKRYNEKQHQQAILAAYGHCSVANDGSYQLSGEEFIQDFWKDSCYDFDSEHGVVSADHHEHALLSPNQKKTTPNSGGQSKTATWQTQAAAVQKAKATALPSVGSSKYGLFSKPSEQQAMFDAADYLAHESVAKSSSISDYTNEIYKFAVGVEDMFFHPLQTAQHVADASVHAAKDIYASRNESARDIITRGVFKHILWQQTATGAEKFGLALNIAASEATFGVARMGVLGRSGKYVPNGGLSGYIERTSKLDYSPISTVAEADFGYLNKAALTKAQAAVVRRVESAISKHAKPHDFLGVEKELAGIRIPKSSGGYFNHVQEMRNTITHLDKQMISIENSLKNPILDSTSRQVLSQAHELARQTVSRMSNSLTSDLGVSIKPLGTRP